MAPKQIYQDDQALDKLLDNLLQTGQDDNSATSAHLSSHSENHFSQSNMEDKLAEASAFLQESRICSGLPALNEDDGNISEVLSHALNAIIHLCKCCKANANLRKEAECSVHVANEELLRIKRLNEMKKEKILRMDAKISMMKKQMSDAEKERKRIVSDLMAECADLKTKCAKSTYRVNHLSLDVKKREREYSLLQKKVQALMTNTKRLSIEPQIVAIVSNNATRQPVISREKSLEREEKEYQDLVGLSEDQCMNEVIVENRALRDLLRAVQEELDDLLISNPSFLHDSKTPGRISSTEQSPTGTEKTAGIKSDTSSRSCEVSLVAHGTPENIKEDTIDNETLKSSLLPSRRSSAGLDKEEDRRVPPPCDDVSRGEENVRHCVEEPKTPVELKHNPVSAPNEIGDQSESEMHEACETQCQEEESEVLSNTANAEVGTPVTGSPERNGAVLSNLTPALSAEQMNMPFEMIRENLERSLDQKFELLRRVVQQVNNKSPNVANA
eukprot:TRINITY_DN455_c0_g1_i1.p1 TRINITY_DN455_c0_g1~~TRINITY_DN455_c0_g1_i1.p1  ORF type:complete len:501 (+),score=81.44 TRINITY_DN455_c0_g1_i1:523-2025(+)